MYTSASYCTFVILSLQNTVASRNEASHADHRAHAGTWHATRQSGLSGTKPRIIVDMYMHILNITRILTGLMRSMSRFESYNSKINLSVLTPKVVTECVRVRGSLSCQINKMRPTFMLLAIRSLAVANRSRQF